MTCTAKRHGTAYAYCTFGCRCDTALAALRKRAKAYKLRRLRQGPEIIDATGAKRRVQALGWMGWGTEEIGRRAGVTGGAVRNVLCATNVYRRTAAAIAAVYDDLCITPGPSKRVHDYAVRAGWVGPLCWDEDDIDDPAATPHGLHDGKQARDVDEIAVERRMAGDHVRLTTDEAREVVERLRRAGVDDRTIERRTRLNPSRYAGSRERKAS